MRLSWLPQSRFYATARGLTARSEDVREAMDDLRRGGLIPPRFMPGYSRAFLTTGAAGSYSQTECPGSIRDAVAFAQYGAMALQEAELNGVAFFHARGAVLRRSPVSPLLRWRAVDEGPYRAERATRRGDFDAMPFAVLRAKAPIPMEPNMRRPCLAIWSAGFAVDAVDELSVTLAFAR